MKHSFIRCVLSATFLLVLLLAVKVEAQATIRRVPADYPTIQQAINASVDGDTVLVAPGTYFGQIDILTKTVTLTSEAGPDLTVLDGGLAQYVVHFGESSGTLSGFTVQNGLFGVSSIFSSAVIRGNIIQNNYAAGVDIGGLGATQVLDNTISANGSIVNPLGGITLHGAGHPIIRGNRIINNLAREGGGINMVNFSDAVIVQNLIMGNHAEEGGGVYWLVIFSAHGPTLVNNTIVDNQAVRGSGIFADGYDGETELVNNIIVGTLGSTAVYCGNFTSNSPRFNFNDVFSPQGTAYGGDCQNKTGMNGNISADPLFVNPIAGDYHLRPGSPSIDAGDNTSPNLPATDFDGNPRVQDGNGDGVVVIDMGAYEALPPLPPFDICIQDDSTGSIFKFNSTTGDYQFSNCSGFTLSGTGTLIKRGSIITLQHYASDRRVLARIDTSVNKATASIQLFSPSATFTITDRNTANNTCACAAH